MRPMNHNRRPLPISGKSKTPTSTLSPTYSSNTPPLRQMSTATSSRSQSTLYYEQHRNTSPTIQSEINSLKEVEVVLSVVKSGPLKLIIYVGNSDTVKDLAYKVGYHFKILPLAICFYSKWDAYEMSNGWNAKVVNSGVIQGGKIHGSSYLPVGSLPEKIIEPASDLVYIRVWGAHGTYEYRAAPTDTFQDVDKWYRLQTGNMTKNPYFYMVGGNRYVATDLLPLEEFKVGVGIDLLT